MLASAEQRAGIWRKASRSHSAACVRCLLLLRCAAPPIRPRVAHSPVFFGACRQKYGPVCELDRLATTRRISPIRLHLVDCMLRGLGHHAGYVRLRPRYRFFKPIECMRAHCANVPCPSLLRSIHSLAVLAEKFSTTHCALHSSLSFVRAYVSHCAFALLAKKR